MTDIPAAQAALAAAQAQLVIAANALAAAPPPPPPPAPGLTVAVTLADGSVHNYQQDGGTDLGNFIGAGFTQRNIRAAIDPALPALKVYFRPDMAPSTRQEVVFELGDMNDKAPADIGAYSVKLSFDGGKTFVSAAPPKHFYNARWRYQSAPRPINVDFPALIAKGLLPPIDKGRTTYVPPAITVKPYTLMGMAGVTPYFPQTGERNDIGILTEETAEWIALGTPAARDQTMANAEASGSVPWHFRDETGSPFSIDRHPDWVLDSRFGSKVYPQAPQGTDPTKATIDDAHQPHLTYVAQLANGDPYLLEELQFQANWHMLSHGTNGGLGLLNNSQIRGLAWTLINLVNAAVATPDVVPSWLLPKSYFARKLENNRIWLEGISIQSINPCVQAFRIPFGISNDQAEIWESDFVVAVIELAVRAGFVTWKALRDWCRKGIKDRTSGTSGWPRSQPTLYVFYLRKPGSPADTVPAMSWADAAVVNGVVVDPADGEAAITDASYTGYLDACLALAAADGDADAAADLVWLDAARTKAGKGGVYDKWAWAPTPVGNPQTQPTVTPDSVPASYVSVPPLPVGQAYTPQQSVKGVFGTPGSGQRVNVWFPKSFASLLDYRNGFVHADNVHAGGSFEASGVDFIVFQGGDTYDTVKHAWTT